IGNVRQVAAGAGKDQATRREQLAILEHFQTGPGPTGYGLSPGGPARPSLVPAEKCEHCLISMSRSSPLTQGKTAGRPVASILKAGNLVLPAGRTGAAALRRGPLPTPQQPRPSVAVRFVESPAGISARVNKRAGPTGQSRPTFLFRPLKRCAGIASV